jgi:alpha-D-xyloside xylohydrolase
MGTLTDDIYRQWSMAMAAFSPIWRPHGPGAGRWPLDRSAESQKDAHTYSNLRYMLMPYIYTNAWRAWKTGYPMAIPMLLRYPEDAIAWKADQQYLFGDNLLVAPNTTAGNNTVRVWLPSDGGWYDYWNDSLYTGGKEIDYYAATGVLPLFARQGAIIPKAPFRQSTFWIPRDTLIVDVYAGKDGSFTLYDDDGVTEKFRKGEFMLTPLIYSESDNRLTIGAASGSFAKAPARRALRAVYHGLQEETALYVNGVALQRRADQASLATAGSGQYWDAGKKQLHVRLPAQPVSAPVVISSSAVDAGPGRLAFASQPRVSLAMPGPGRYTLRLEAVGERDRATVVLSDVKGRIIVQRQLTARETLTLPTGLATGVYHLKVSGGKVRFARNIMLMR